ncbi:ABC transporter permease [Dongia sp.]|uniref:ABC transporter permease n=1 Tax=Dongia sp. TaxID=1977262 RepID=UPI0035B1A0D6
MGVRRFALIDLGKAAPLTALVLLVGSIGVGLFFVAALGLGYLPALGGNAISWGGFASLLGDGRVPRALVATALTGWLATLAATAAAFALVASLGSTGDDPQSWPQRIAVAVLAVPHLAMALGLAFVLAPSGWFVRAIAALTGLLPLPPNAELVSREYGLALALALFIKETPFLFVAMATALRQIDAARFLATARTLGYGEGMAWAKLVLPQLYPLVRFPILAVLAYGLSVVDMALILGPTTPPTLPVLILAWINDPDLGRRFVAASAALLQVGMVTIAIMLWWLGEWLCRRMGRRWLTAGLRDWGGVGRNVIRWFARIVGLASITLTALALLALLLWSVAEAWRYPALLPAFLSLDIWQRSLAGLWNPLVNSLELAATATVLALALTLACLQHERVLRAKVVRSAERWLFLPLLVPEVSFLFGLQILLLLIGFNGTWLAVLWMHLLFVFPYVFLTLKEPWRAFDPRYERIALSLGKSPWTVFWRIKLPLLRGQIAWAAAIGCATSLSLYLPTVQGGEGRIVTLASEAVALSGGGDRRVVGVYGTIQAAAAGLCFALALWTARPRRRWVS